MTLDERVADIKAHPDRHQHTYDQMIRCCSEEEDGIPVINTYLMQAHADFAPTGTNGGVKCDVTEGPCSCGAWH